MQHSTTSPCHDMDSQNFVTSTSTHDSDQMEFKPYVGMEFRTDRDAYDFYNAYALRCGFGIRKTSSIFSRKEVNEGAERELIGRTFVCNKEGKNVSQLKEGTEGGRRRESRVGCCARMRITLNKSKMWVVSKFIEQHNGHTCISPDKAVMHRSHTTHHRSEAVRSLIGDLHEEGINPSNISRVVNVATGMLGDYEARVTPQQCQSHLRKERRSNIGHECSSVIDQFANKKLSDPDFYFAFELDDNRTMRSVFWADGRSRTSYLEFGDVIVFDVTYRTNKLCLPFAPFTGVNHHRQSTLFGCALLADENEGTFVWLFSEWLKCMHGQPPISIIIDQDLAIGNAIKRVFPNVRHRYCSWHIGRHVVEHLPCLARQHGDSFTAYYNKWYFSSTVEQAERHWTELREKFVIDEDENTWLPTMYRKRQHWIEVYLKDTFWAGMRSTQRSESINAYFDGFVNSQTRLHEFIGAYDKAVAARRAAELHEDFVTLNTKPVLSLCSHPIEMQAGELYTRKIFTMFQDEIKACIVLFREEVKKEGSNIFYSVGPINEDRSKRHQVIFDSAESINMKCTCALFETAGILCKHILNVMLFGQQLQHIPEQYVLHRWRIDARHRSRNMLERKNLCKLDRGNFLYGWTVRAKFNDIWERSLRSRKLLGDLDEFFTSFEARLEPTAIQFKESSVASNVAIHELEEHITIRDPSASASTKGRPKKATRLRSQREEAIEKSQKKQRTCQNCFQKGHYRTSCKNPPATKPLGQDSGDDWDGDSGGDE